MPAKLRAPSQTGGLTPARAKPFAGLAARSISHCEARETGRRLYLLFVREQRSMTEQDTKRKWQEDPKPAKFCQRKRKSGRSSAAFLLRGERVGGRNDC